MSTSVNKKEDGTGKNLALLATSGPVKHCLISAWEQAPASGVGLPEIPEVPAGLVRCARCSEFNGSARFAPPAWGGEGREVEVICRCHGPLCRHCGMEQIHRPCSYSYHEASGLVLRVAYFYYLARCQSCKASEGEGAIIEVPYELLNPPAGANQFAIVFDSTLFGELDAPEGGDR